MSDKNDKARARLSVWNPTFLILCGLALGIALGWVLAGALPRGCGDVKDAPWGCVEFALARYQTLLAALVAGAIAVFAARPAFRQLTELRKQSLAHARATLLDAVDNFEQEISEVGDPLSMLEVDAWVSLTLERSTEEELQELIDMFRKCLDALHVHTTRGFGSDELHQARTIAAGKTTLLLLEIQGISESYARKPQDPVGALEGYKSALKDYRTLIRKENKALHKELRLLEIQLRRA